MSLRLMMEEAIEAVPEGQYKASVVDARGIDGPHGPMVKMDFMISGDDECDGRQVSGVASRRMSENSKLGRWVAAILGRLPEVGEEVSARDLVGKDCRIAVKHRTSSDGKTFANVTDVLAPADSL